MAINSTDDYDDSPTKSLDSCSWQINIASKKPGSFNNESVTSSSSFRSKKQSKSVISPYLSGDKVKLLSRVTEKKMVHRKTTGFMSSFPLAANIYKANSDELKVAKRNNKKVKKSVLTLPNDPPSLPQACTVSDMNDSEYNETKNLRKPKPKKRRNIKKYPIVDKNIEIYDRDARYLSQLNINLDSSSTDMFKHLTGDGSRVIKKAKTNAFGRKQAIDNDVWAVLRNINKMQFISSPPMSLDSIESLKKSKTSKKRSSDRKDTRFIETCRTEEFAYISYDSNSINSCSRSTSFDRITVIGRQDEVKETCTKIQDERNEATQNGIAKNQKRKRFSRIAAIDNRPNNIKDKKDKHLKLKPPQSLSYQDSENEINTRYNKQIRNKGKENIPKAAIEENKSMALAIRMNSDKNDEPENKTTSLKTSSPQCVPEEASLASLDESQEQLNGITRVVVSKGKDIEKCKQQEVIRKPRLVTTMPSSAGVPRLTQADIKRRLANIKFPIVVTGKDQLSSFIQVPYNEPYQFCGLDKRIWPYMINWLPKTHTKNDLLMENKNKLLPESTVQTGINKSLVRATNKSPLVSNDYKENQICISPRKSVKESSRFSKDDGSSLDLSTTQSKVRPIRHFKDKMMNLFYNKPSRFQEKCSTKKETKDTKHVDANKNINTENQICTSFNKSVREKYKSISKPNENVTRDSLKPGHMWAKARWASDFIENVIRKIKSGIYYDAECQRYYQSIDAEDRYTQTDKYLSNSIEQEDKGKFDDKEIIDEFFDTKVIPGFDDSWRDLELESITQNKIAVKHCLTNVVVQFDIALPFDNKNTLQPKQSFSCVPLAVTESQTKIYKYKTSIMNAVLPAEICSILPKMLSNIFDSKAKLAITKFDKIESPLTTITELQPCNNNENPLCSPFSNLFPHVRRLQYGHFSSVSHTLDSVCRTKKYKITGNGYTIFSNVLPDINRFIWEPNIYIHFETFKQDKTINNNLEIPPVINKCMALVPYVPVVPNIIFGSANSFKNLENGIESAVYSNIYSFMDSFGSLTLNFFHNKMVIEMLKKSFMENELPIIVNNKDTDVIYSYIQYNYYSNNKALLLHDENTTGVSTDFKKTLESVHKQFMEPRKNKLLLNNVNKKRSYIKLNKKCKSTSSISSYKKHTPLQKIANLDEFFQVLGLSKDLLSVIDGNVERKILSSIVEMKSWTPDITPRQALLLFLLANKKETSNLIRFRTIILQGIAMNRITKASELDMEIEVIERETLNKLPQYEGISYLPASIENQDNLLEELCWIAKTTASDYQRPFDRSSERLLKSLLNKRKKLNPSYLRVMARYVGLGLLKSK